MKTLKGYTEVEIVDFMRSSLPDGAYKKHPTKGYLTTISPAYMRERLTKIFGLFGWGWGLEWNPADTAAREFSTAKGKPRFGFAITQASFWYKLVDDDNNATVVSFQVTGYSDNDNVGDAMAGARTSCISAGAKELLFQLHIYKNTAPPPKRSPIKKGVMPGDGKMNKEHSDIDYQDAEEEIKADSRGSQSPQAQGKRERPSASRGDGLNWREKLEAMARPTLGNVANFATLASNGGYKTDKKGSCAHAMNAISKYDGFPDGWEGNNDTVIKPENAIKVFDWLLERKK